MEIENTDNAIQLKFMGEKPDNFVNVWEDLLSRDARVIRAAFSLLEDEARRDVIKHLQNMVNQPGWQEEQVISAKFALESLSSRYKAGQENDGED